MPSFAADSLNWMLILPGFGAYCGKPGEEADGAVSAEEVVPDVFPESAVFASWTPFLEPHAVMVSAKAAHTNAASKAIPFFFIFVPPFILFISV